MRAAVAGCRGIAPTGLTALRMLERKKEGKKEEEKERQRGASVAECRHRSAVVVGSLDWL